MSDRIILHIDGNNFFASCECLLAPELQEVPMAVAGDPASRHGIILAKNQLAKAKGVQTAEAIWQARRKCPELVLTRPHHDFYEKISRSMNEIFLQYTDLVEPASIDESYLDVTGSLHLFGNDPVALADRIREQVFRELGITVSVGVSFCKVFAKLGSDYRKPNATTHFPRQAVEEMIWPMPVENLLFVGRQFAQSLRQLGIRTIGDLAQAEEELLRRKFGLRGEQAQRSARGYDSEPVRPYHVPRPVKSIGNSTTYPRDLVGRRQIRLGFLTLAESVSRRMQLQQVRCRRVQIQIRDPDFHTLSRQVTLERSLWLAGELCDVAMELADQLWRYDRPVRLLSLTAEQLIPLEEDTSQISLFPDPDQTRREKQVRLEGAMTSIRDKFGKGAIHRAGVDAMDDEKKEH